MILINLLPHREAKRQQRKQAFFIALGLSAVVGAGIVGIWATGLQQLQAAQATRNDLLREENRKLDVQIRDIATLRTEIEALKARQAAVENLQTDRNVPVYLLDELASQAPEGIFLSSIRQRGSVVTITGVAQTNERVAEFLRNTLDNSPWLENPELVEIKAATVSAQDRNRGAAASDEQRRLFEFSMRVSIKRPQAATAEEAVGDKAPGGARPAKAS